MLLGEARGKTKVGQLDVATTIEENIVWLDITFGVLANEDDIGILHLPVYETQLVDSLNGQSNLCHVESCDVLGENFILDEHSHQVTAGQELHEHIQKCVILERCV